MIVVEDDTRRIDDNKVGLPSALKAQGALDALVVDPADVLAGASVEFRAKAKKYGDFRAMMDVFAGLISQRLGNEVSAADAAGIMVDLKQARLLHNPKCEDSAHDKIVYEAMRSALVKEEGGV